MQIYDVFGLIEVVMHYNTLRTYQIKSAIAAYHVYGEIAD